MFSTQIVGYLFDLRGRSDTRSHSIIEDYQQLPKHSWAGRAYKSLILQGEMYFKKLKNSLTVICCVTFVTIVPFSATIDMIFGSSSTGNDSNTL